MVDETKEDKIASQAKDDSIKPDNSGRENEDYKEKYLYLLAEFDNYRKSLEKQQSESEKLIKEKLILDIIKVLDDFDSVLKKSDDNDIKTLMKSLYGVLKSYGLSRMEVVGQEYSPDLAEAVASENIKDKAGKIIEEIQAGYKLNDKVIRYPKVKIAI